MKASADYPVPGFRPAYSGKVREIYDLGEELVIVATDRISVYDVVLPTRIPGKGEILTSLSAYWFRGLEHVVRTHFLSVDIEEFPEPFRSTRGLARRAMRVRKAERLDVECVVRGYLAGSGLRDYQRSGIVSGVRLPAGLRPYQELPEPIFTPTTKAASGHDEAITFDEMSGRIGSGVAQKLRELSLRIYRLAAGHARERGVIIADTKFEFGRRDGEIILIDEVLTPDSSRFWDLTGYTPGREPDPMDKQYVRNLSDTMAWDHTPPGPALPEAAVAETLRRYRTAVERITRGETEPDWKGGRP